MNTKEVPVLLTPDFLLSDSNHYYITAALFVLVIIIFALFYYVLPRIKQAISLYQLLSKYKNESVSQKTLMYQLTSVVNFHAQNHRPIFNENEIVLINRIKYDKLDACETQSITVILKKAIRASLVGKY